MLKKQQIFCDKYFDHTCTLLKEGYLFIPNRVERYQSDLFETRLLGKKVICISGKEAAKKFYNTERFKRKGALPKRIQKTLFGINGIQTMDGDEHIHRKQLFMSLMDEAHEKQLMEITIQKWQEALYQWEMKEEIVLFDEVKKILCKAACEWAGVPLLPFEVESRAEDFSAMVYALGAMGPKYWKGKKARVRTEKWIRDIIRDIRSGKRKIQKDTPLYQVAFYKELNGSMLDVQIASIELINIIRPIVAVSVFITFMALALYEYGETKEKLLLEKEDGVEMFVQEVRRYYPFTPFLGAVVKRDFIWKQCKFRKGTLVLLDVYGTNHDSRIWEEPYEFRPERFSEKRKHLFDFMPQGGGDPRKGHRCPGEGITIELMKVSLDFLLNKIDFKIPKQDLSYNPKRIPTLPKSGFIMSHIRRKSCL